MCVYSNMDTIIMSKEIILFQEDDFNTAVTIRKSTTNSNLSILASKSVDSLIKIPGIGKDKAATLSAAFEISRRVDSKEKYYSNKKINSHTSYDCRVVHII